MRFAETLKHIRKSKGFNSQNHLAKKSGISQASINRLESGKQTPKLSTIIALSKALDCNIQDFESDNFKVKKNSVISKIALESIKYSVRERRKAINEINRLLTLNDQELLSDPEAQIIFSDIYGLDREHIRKGPKEIKSDRVELIRRVLRARKEEYKKID